METSHLYPRAPVTEAIIDLRVTPRDGLEIQHLESLGASLVNNYPIRRDRKVAQGSFEVGAQISAAASTKQVGYAFVSADEKQVVQARLDGFSFSRLAPYESWRPFRDEAQKCWRLYREQTTPLALIRLAVRYINRIDIPETHFELKDYLRTSPEISPDLPQFLDGFFFQVLLPQTDLQSRVILNETIVPSPNPNTTSVVLDIDLFRDANMPQEEVAVWDFFESLHARKNQIFEACITDKTRELFQ